ncbi:Card1-like endonuclease domain-containing protein [Wenzhouxiangella marina]|uniref:Card1 endonuclease domain-containing protein n=1 Tax=Wenzhouxiangella marina TaxID=1579979 RepID=A0A0K0XXW4_9GAMM|nr:DUF1887 family CARF protein [Wenzhouxiangella marina]AKS42472.1 hypothetical protein WM2015_2107 [Wenzhouxiangella marina]MBB6085753.1 hypothetical protein [Wenzhouxiangella marina]
MNLLLFPSGDALHDLVLPLHLRPERVWLLATPEHADSQASLGRLLGGHGLPSEKLSLPEFDNCTDPSGALIELLAPVIEGERDAPLILALGASASPWELVAEQVLAGLLEERDLRVLALTGQARRMVQLRPSPITLSEVPSLLVPDDYLGACGATLRRASSDSTDYAENAHERRELSLEMARRCGELGGSIGALNYVAIRALDRETEALTYPRQHLSRQPGQALREMLDAFQSAGLIDYDGRRELVFQSTAACRYLAGGWLEEYAWLTASELEVEHLSAGLELTWNGGRGMEPRNELDLFVLHHNRALTVECKTANMGRGDTTARILYKLDSIADRLSSLPGNAVLLSAREVPELIVKRADAQGIAVLSGGQLPRFRDWLRRWMKN